MTMLHRFDVLVVGGGVIGASIAWRLARGRASVLLLDAAGLRAEASSTAAGMLTPAGEFAGASPLLDFAVSSLARYPEYAASIASDSGCPVELRHGGGVQVALTEDELRLLAERASALRSRGIRSQILSSRQLSELAPLIRDGAVGGIHYPDELTVDPQALMKALGAACLACGVFVVEGAPVISVLENSHAVRAALSDRAFEARFAVIAAGAWSDQIRVSIRDEPYALPQSFPVKGHLLGYRLPPGSFAASVRHDHTYVLQRADGFTVAGSSTENVGFDASINAEIVADIRARAGALVPALARLEPERVWTGFRPATADLKPHIERVGDSRIWLAYGHYRNGILLAPATCDQVCPEIEAALRR